MRSVNKQQTPAAFQPSQLVVMFEISYINTDSADIEILCFIDIWKYQGAIGHERNCKVYDNHI